MSTAGSWIINLEKQKRSELTPEKAMDASTKQTDDVIHFVMLTRMAILLLNRINNFLVLRLSLLFNNWYLVFVGFV